MKKSVLSVLLVLSVLFVASCSGGNVQGGDRPLDTAAALQQVKTGTQGIEVTLQENYPPALIYDQNELLAIVNVHNKGNYNLPAQDCMIQITGFDPNIIGGGFSSPRSCAENNGGDLEGKNVYNVQGTQNQLEFKSTVNLPNGVQDYQPTLNILACYNYKTQANPVVCIDPAFYQVTTEQKTCRPQSVSMAGGQGGPVGVSYVNVNMAGKKAIFEISVRNYGQGRVLSPFSNLQSCGQSTLKYTDLDKVRFNVQMTSGGLIDCKPRDGFVRLVNNQGKIVCSFNSPNTAAFETPLQIGLDYSYVQSLKRQTRIVQTPQ